MTYLCILCVHVRMEIFLLSARSCGGVSKSLHQHLVIIIMPTHPGHLSCCTAANLFYALVKTLLHFWGHPPWCRCKEHKKQPSEPQHKDARDSWVSSWSKLGYDSRPAHRGRPYLPVAILHACDKIVQQAGSGLRSCTQSSQASVLGQTILVRK